MSSRLEGHRSFEERLESFVVESNAIERIQDTRAVEIEAHAAFLALPRIRVSDLEAFVGVVTDSKAVLRDRKGLDVVVGKHTPPSGGPQIRLRLEAHLDLVNKGPHRIAGDPDWFGYPAFDAHVDYETLHPFTDGNGRSGRVLWAWQMLREETPPGIDLGFLHAFYYQALDFERRAGC